MSASSPRVVLVGAGNVAAGLAGPLMRSGVLVAWANRTVAKVRELLPEASTVEALPLEEVAESRPDIVVVSVADGALDSVVSSIGAIGGSPLCLLTSGSVAMERLRPLSHRTGVVYPLQTFTEGFPVDIAEVPFFTEASSPADLAIVDDLVRLIGATPYHADATERRTLHLAGVLTNNFVNILLEQTEQVLAAKGYPLATVRPLIEMTVRKAFALGPHAAQTGPARRGDAEVMRGQYALCPPSLRPAFAALNALICESHGNALPADII